MASMPMTAIINVTDAMHPVKAARDQATTNASLAKAICSFCRGNALDPVLPNTSATLQSISVNNAARTAKNVMDKQLITAHNAFLAYL